MKNRKPHKDHSLYDFFRMNGVKFNILFGLISMTVLPLIADHVDLQEPGPFAAIMALLFYFAEAWAFHYKTTLMRLRVHEEIRNTKKESVPVPGIGCMVGYGFLMRLVFRIVLLVIAMAGFGGLPEGDEDPPAIFIVIMIVGVLFEIFLLGYGWMETRLMNTEETEGERNQEEQKWYKKWKKLLDTDESPLREAGADFVLFVSAIMYTHSFWTMSNLSFIESIDSSYANGEPGWGVFLLIVVANFILCLFMLVPVRLAFWVGESLQTFTSKDRWRLRGSLVFAGISVTAPVFSHFISVYGR